MSTRLLLNGKKSGQENIREAVNRLRKEGYELDVRITWEGGDFERLVIEASQQQVTRIIVGGGDGSINEVASAMLNAQVKGISLAILPLGTANDFASACEIPLLDPYQALHLALTGDSFWIDAVQVNERYFINLATAGFGAQVTATTPVALKNFLGGGAYTLSGLVQAINFQPFQGVVKYDGKERQTNMVVGAVCNGRQAGGGQVLAPNAFIDDGLLEAVSLEHFNVVDVASVIDELQQLAQGNCQFVKREQVKKVEWISDKTVMPINLDGEPISDKRVCIEVLPQAIAAVLPERCPLLKEAILAK